MRKVLSGVVMEIMQGNIAAQNDITAVVNAANAWLMPGGGVAGAIHSAAGSGLAEECRLMAPIKPGEAVISGGHNLPNKYVLHCLGPVYGKDVPSEELLADCYRNALILADSHGIDSIAFPAISTGIFGYPVFEAAEVAFKTITKLLPQLKAIKLIRFILFGEKDYLIHEAILTSY